MPALKYFQDWKEIWRLILSFQRICIYFGAIKQLKNLRKSVVCNCAPACSDKVSYRKFRKYGGKYIF